MNTLSDQHCQLTKLDGTVSMLDKNEIKLIAGCYEVAEANLMNGLGFHSMVSSIESFELLERAHELFLYLSVQVFPGAYMRNKKLEAGDKL